MAEGGFLSQAVQYTTGLKVVGTPPFLKPTPFAATWAFPQPIGIVPARVFHLERRWLGFTFHDFTEPLTGVKEPQDVLKGTKEGNELYVFALKQIAAAQSLTPTQLAKGVAAFQRLDAERLAGAPDKVRIQGAVFALESQRRLSPTTLQLQPTYLPGGGVGIGIGYFPQPKVPLPFMAGAATPAPGEPGLRFPLGSRPVAAATAPTEQPVAAGSILPALIKPVNAAALANEQHAEGINRELVAERADP